jgi:hypothetical protein
MVYYTHTLCILQVQCTVVIPCVHHAGMVYYTPTLCNYVHPAGMVYSYPVYILQVWRYYIHTLCTSYLAGMVYYTHTLYTMYAAPPHWYTGRTGMVYCTHTLFILQVWCAVLTYYICGALGSKVVYHK